MEILLTSNVTTAVGSSNNSAVSQTSGSNVTTEVTVTSKDMKVNETLIKEAAGEETTQVAAEGNSSDALPEETTAGESTSNEVDSNETVTGDGVTDEAATDEGNATDEAVTDEAAPDKTVTDDALAEEGATDEAINGEVTDTSVVEGEDLTVDVGVSDPNMDPSYNEDMGMGEGIIMDPGMAGAKDPLLSSWPFVIGISVAVLFVSIALGAFLAKRKIKKGIEIYED